VATLGETVGATGRRKEAVARVRLIPGTGQFKLNGRALVDYFPRPVLQMIVTEPLRLTNTLDAYDIVARIEGGGMSGQAGAVRHGIARALIIADPTLRSELKRKGMLTRDARAKERRKYGLKKARKAPQFSKR
jgi:small subunit ribosomal protein S9